jgi:hypothetical protein
MKKAFALVTAVSVALSMLSLLAGRIMAAPFWYIQPTILTPGSGFNPLSSPAVVYDEQLGLTFVDNFTLIAYNVTANRQEDNYQYGPAYLVNGLSDTGYWYQAGLAWDWPYQDGGYWQGFNFVYEVFFDGSPVFPGGYNGVSPFNGSVNVGDSVRLELYFSGGNVTMSASDLKTGAYASQTYFRESAVKFIGLTSSPSNSYGYFSGLMTEWQHVDSYFGNEAQVPYFDNNSTGLKQALMWMDEFQIGNPSWPYQWDVYSPYDYTSEPNQLQEFAPGYGATEYSDAYVFETGAPALCALKTQADGLFYVPNATYVNTTCLRVEMLFNDANLAGDQSGVSSPYPAITNYPDGKVNGDDYTFVASKFGSYEGETSPIAWDYMADIVPDRRITGDDLIVLARHSGYSGSYNYNVFLIEINFNTGDSEIPNAIGFVPIPAGATSFNVTDPVGNPWGAMIVFCGS